MEIKRRGQEEMVGFVMIVVVVAIVFLLLLSFYINSGGTERARESGEIYQFLESLGEYTTDCAVSFEPAFSSIGELYEQCYSNRVCVNGEQSCKILNETISDILVESWFVDDQGAVKGYSFKSVYSTNNSEEEIIRVDRGNCTSGIATGSEYISPAFPGTIVTSLELCF
jgi:hypothetical protein